MPQIISAVKNNGITVLPYNTPDIITESESSSGPSIAISIKLLRLASVSLFLSQVF